VKGFSGQGIEVRTIRDPAYFTEAEMQPRERDNFPPRSKSPAGKSRAPMGRRSG